MISPYMKNKKKQEARNKIGKICEEANKRRFADLLEKGIIRQLEVDRAIDKTIRDVRCSISNKEEWTDRQIEEELEEGEELEIIIDVK